VSLVVSDLGVRYGQRHALAGVSLEAKPGEVTAIIGPNGSGKSSLIRAIAGLITHQGSVSCGADGAARIGYLPQDVGSRAALTVLEVVLLGRLRALHLRLTDADLDAAGAALATLGIEHLASRDLAELSGGQRQLVFLAQVLASEPQILLLDEPISALDIRNQVEVLDTVRRLTRERGLTTLMVLHELSAAARAADRIIVLKEGKVAGDGLPDSVLTTQLLRDVFGIDAIVVQVEDAGLVVLPRKASCPYGHLRATSCLGKSS
jgi:iron complex transport system ATP-binding protein